MSGCKTQNQKDSNFLNGGAGRSLEKKPAMLVPEKKRKTNPSHNRKKQAAGPRRQQFVLTEFLN